MKKIAQLVVVICMAFGQIVAQNLKVEEIVENMSKGSQKGLSIEISEVSQDFVIKEFKDWVGKFKGKTKIDKKNDEIFSDDAFMKEISANTFDLYGKVIPKGKNQKLVVFVDLGGAFLNSQMHADKYKIFENQLMEFGRNLIKNDLKNRLDEAEKKLKDLNKDKKDLENEQAKSLKNIEDYKNNIKKEEENIEVNKKKQAEKEKEINSQSKVVEELKIQYNQLKK